MEFPNALLEQPPKLYDISEQEFKRESAPAELQPYNPDENLTVTRANFTNYLITNFKVSRGDPVVLILFMLWLKVKSGFDYAATFTNFVQAGGWDALSEQEKTKFNEQYDRVLKHSSRASEHEDKIILSLIHTELRAKEASRIEADLPLSHIQKIETFTDFQSFAHQKGNSTRDSIYSFIANNIE